MDNKILEPSCPNCARLEDQLYHESRKAPEVEYKMGHEIELLKSQLEMCKKTLEFYADKNNWKHGNKFMPIDCENMEAFSLSDEPHGKRARECLQKLERSE